MSKKEFKGTKGTAKVIEFPDGSDCFVQCPKLKKDHGYDIEVLQDGHDEETYPYEQKKADAYLLADAINVRQQIDFDLPELLERYKLLEEYFKISIGSVFNQTHFDRQKIIIETLKNQ